MPPRIATSTTHSRTYFESAKQRLDEDVAVDLVDVVFVGEKVVARGHGWRRACRVLSAAAIEAVGDEPADGSHSDGKNAKQDLQLMATALSLMRPDGWGEDTRRSGRCRSSRRQLKAMPRITSGPSMDQGLSCG